MNRTMTGTTTRFSLSRRRLYTTMMIAILCSGGSAIAAKIKCWTNNEGVRECGNLVPPEYAQQGHEEKSAGGVTVKTTGRAKSLEELELERSAEREKAATALRAREQAAKNRVLLDTFSSEEDMLLARDGQIAHLESQIKLTESHIQKLERSLDELVKNAADHERQGKHPPEKLVRDIESLGKQVRDNRVFIETKRRESAKIVEKFEVDIVRFRALKGRAD